jgi:hypothetical protein
MYKPTVKKHMGVLLMSEMLKADGIKKLFAREFLTAWVKEHKIKVSVSDLNSILELVYEASSNHSLLEGLKRVEISQLEPDERLEGLSDNTLMVYQKLKLLNTNGAHVTQVRVQDLMSQTNLSRPTVMTCIKQLVEREIIQWFSGVGRTNSTVEFL